MKTIAEFLPLFVRSRHERNLRSATMVNYGVWARWLIRHWGGRQPAGVTPEEITGLVAVRSRNSAQHVQCFLRWLIDQRHLPRDYEVPRLPLPPRSDERQITYLRPRAAHELLAAVRPECRAAFALALYAGLRPYECCRIGWESIHLAERRVRVEARVSKIRRARIIEGVPQVLWWWLRRCPRGRGGRVLPASDDDHAVFRWIAERRRAARAADVVLSHDVLRHTFATYYIALTRNLGAAAKVLGHYKLQTLIAHYDGVTTRTEAREYFARPKTAPLRA